jgi:hypothetical protein
VNELDLLVDRIGLEADAATVRGLLLEDGGSAKADAYVVEVRFAERLQAFRAAGGSLS